MGIQDLGAIGEFISSLVIVATLVVLIFEVRSSNTATIEANAQERQRKRDAVTGGVAETPHLAAIWVKADAHLGDERSREVASEYGLEPHEWRQLSMHFYRLMANWREAYYSELPDRERRINDASIVRQITESPALRRHYQADISARWGTPGRPGEAFIRHVDQLLVE